MRDLAQEQLPHQGWGTRLCPCVGDAKKGLKVPPLMIWEKIEPASRFDVINELRLNGFSKSQILDGLRGGTTYIQDTIIIISYVYIYAFWKCWGFLRVPLVSKINFSIKGTWNSHSINRLFGRQNHIYLAFDRTFPHRGCGIVTWR